MSIVFRNPTEEFRTPSGTYVLEKGVRNLLCELWDNVFKFDGKVERLFSSLERSGSPDLYSVLVIWLFMRKNRKYVDEFQKAKLQTKRKSLAEIWMLEAALSPKIVDPTNMERQFHTRVFRRTAIRLLDPKNNLDWELVGRMLPKMKQGAYPHRVLILPPHATQNQIRRELERAEYFSSSSTGSFKPIKASNVNTLLDCLLVLYLSDNHSGKDLGRAYNAAYRDMFSSTTPHRSDGISKVQARLKRGHSIANHAPFNFLFAAR